MTVVSIEGVIDYAGIAVLVHDFAGIAIVGPARVFAGID